MEIIYEIYFSRKTKIYAIEDGSDLISYVGILEEYNDGGYYLKNIIRVQPSELRDLEFEDGVDIFLRNHNMHKSKNMLEEKTNNYEVPFTKDELNLFGYNVENILRNLDKITPIGIGHFRFVYDLGNYVLKVARERKNFNSKLINKSEAESRLHQDFPDLTVKTLKHAPDYSWIIQEKAIPLKTETQLAKFFPEINISDVILFEKIGSEIGKAMNCLKSEFIKPEVRDKKETKKNLKRFKEFSYLIQRLTMMCVKYGVDPFDFKPNNFGLVDGNRLVLLDIGTHYSNTE